MREHEKARSAKELDSSLRRTSRHRLSANNWTTRLAAIIGIYNDDWRPGSYSDLLSGSEFANRLTIIFISASAVGFGIGQLVAYAIGY